MKYTLQENAMSSFHLAMENFKKFFYKSKSYSTSELDEARKLCAIFLENSIELLLKALLAKNDETSIYTEPKSSLIKKAMVEAMNQNIELEDVLVEKGNFKTITYTQTIEKFNGIYTSERTKNILLKISEYRNQLTHFGIKTEDNNEFTIACINVFAVIYQNLFEEIITLEKIEPYFTDDGMFVRTFHGCKCLLDKNNDYNNIVDFLDELVGRIAPDIFLEYRLKNNNYKINEWCMLFNDTVKNANFQKMLDYYEVSIDWKNSDISHNAIAFKICDLSCVWDSIFSSYCPYYNATIFTGESGIIYFRILHSSNEIVIYFKDVVQSEYWMPQYEEDDWNKHISCGYAKKYSLTKRNIRLAFKKICEDIKNYRERNNID